MLLVTLLSVLLLNALSRDVTPSPPLTQPDEIGATQKFTFHSYFWLNMHHFMYIIAQVADPADDPDEALTPILMELSESERRELMSGVSFYRDSVIRYDLRRSVFLSGFKVWLITNPAMEQLREPEDSAYNDLVSQLNSLRSLYADRFWPAHDSANRKVLSENIDIIKAIEVEAATKLSKLSQSPWQVEPIRVDISYYSKRNRPYTSLYPFINIVMEVRRNAQPPGNWIELLFHESSHHLITDQSPLNATIQTVSSDLDIKPPRQFWHAILFYFSGRVSQELLSQQGLADYELYMVRKGVFSNYHPFLNKNFDPYMNGETSLRESVSNFLKSWSTRSTNDN